MKTIFITAVITIAMVGALFAANQFVAHADPNTTACGEVCPGEISDGMNADAAWMCSYLDQYPTITGFGNAVLALGAKYNYNSDKTIQIMQYSLERICPRHMALAGQWSAWAKEHRGQAVPDAPAPKSGRYV